MNMRKATLWISNIVPGIILTWLISRRGLLCIVIGIVTEILVLYIHRRALLTLQQQKQHACIQLFFSSVGIIMGYFFYPIAAHPELLGIAVLITAEVMHFAIFQIVSSLFLSNRN